MFQFFATCSVPNLFQAFFFLFVFHLIDFEELKLLQGKLAQIQEARRLNALIKAQKMEQLQIIDLLLWQHSPKYSSISQPPSRNIKIPSLSKENINDIISVFWGKKKFVNQNSIPNHPIFPNDDNEADESTQPEEGEVTNSLAISDNWGRKFSYNDRRLLTLNQNLKPLQKASLLSITGSIHPIYTISRAFVYPINASLSFYDKVRIIVFIKVYGSKFDFNTHFPTINTKRIQQLMNDIQNQHYDNSHIHQLSIELKQRIE